MTRTLVLLVAVGVVLPSTARAQAARVEVMVAAVSNSCKQVDGALKSMEQDFRQNGVVFTCYRLAGNSSLNLSPGQSAPVALPNGSASLTYVKAESAGAIRLRVASPGMSSEYTMGARAQIYLDAGAHAGGKIFLALRR